LFQAQFSKCVAVLNGIHLKFEPHFAILGLQSFPRECENKDMAATLYAIIKDDEEYGGYNVTCNRRILRCEYEIQ
jgi:hypothetical protein